MCGQKWVLEKNEFWIKWSSNIGFISWQILKKLQRDDPTISNPKPKNDSLLQQVCSLFNTLVTYIFFFLCIGYALSWMFLMFLWSWTWSYLMLIVEMASLNYYGFLRMLCREQGWDAFYELFFFFFFKVYKLLQKIIFNASGSMVFGVCITSISFLLNKVPKRPFKVVVD